MAMEALLVGVVERLRDQLGYTLSQCEIQPDGQPPAGNGEQVYAAVHPGAVTAMDPESEADQNEYAVSVTITLKAGKLPQDRMGTGLVALPSTGLLARARAVVGAVRMSYTVLTTANALLPSGESEFIEPLRFLSFGPSMSKPASWLWSDAKQTGPAAIVIEVRFGKCRRYEVFPDAASD